MKKVVLINPRLVGQGAIKKGHSANLNPPIGLLCLGAYLEKDYEVKILDCRLIENHLEALKQELSTGDVVCVGIGAMTVQIEDGLLLSETARAVRNDLPIVWGGIHCTLFQAQTCDDPLIDYVVAKEGEKTFLELVNLLARTDGKPAAEQLTAIKGLAFKKDGAVVVNTERELLDAEEIPMPAYHLVDMEAYLEKSYWYLGDKKFRGIPIHAGRGCYYRCTFCINTLLNKRRWRGKTAKRVLEEIESVVKKYKVNLIVLMDEDFFADKRRVEEIANGLIARKLGIVWDGNVRANYFRDNYINGEFMAKLKQSGCTMLGLGVESGSERIRQFLKKDITIDGVYRCATLCNQYDIIPDFSFIVGLPTETKAELKETLALVYKLKQMCPKAVFAGLQPFRPYPGGELWEFCKTYGFKEASTLRAWAGQIRESNYADVKTFPWVQDPEFVNEINYYLAIFQVSHEKLKKSGAIIAVFAPLVNLRWKYQLWNALYEYKLYSAVAKALGKDPRAGM